MTYLIVTVRPAMTYLIVTVRPVMTYLIVTVRPATVTSVTTTGSSLGSLAWIRLSWGRSRKAGWLLKWGGSKKWGGSSRRDWWLAWPSRSQEDTTQCMCNSPHTPTPPHPPPRLLHSHFRPHQWSCRHWYRSWIESWQGEGLWLWLLALVTCYMWQMTTDTVILSAYVERFSVSCRRDF